MMKYALACISVFAPALAWAGIVDANNNGLSDLWEAKVNYLHGIHSPVYDYDDDGYTTQAEHDFGTNPFIASSRPQSGTAALVPPDAQFIFPTVKGIRYQPQTVEDLGGTWTNVGSPITGDGTVKTVSTIAPSGGQLFWRTLAVAPVDADADGLNAYEEALFGTDDTKESTDADVESDLAEYQKDTDPNNPDTDGDGFPDGEDEDPNNPADGIPISTDTRKYNIRVTATGIFNPTLLSPPIPNFTLAIGSPSIATVTHVDVTTNPATPGVRWTNRFATLEKSIDKGIE